MYETTLSFDLLDLQSLVKHLQNGDLKNVVEGVVYDKDLRKLTVMAYSTITPENAVQIESLLSTYSNPPEEIPKQIVNMGLQRSEVNFGNFSTLYIYKYQQNTQCSLKEFHFLSLSLPGIGQTGTEYMVRLVDVTTNTILGSITCNNTNEQEWEMHLIDGDFANESHTLEVQAKMNTPGVAVLLSAHLVLHKNV